MHQNGWFGRYETVAKLAAKNRRTKRQCDECTLSSAASEEFYKILFCFACFAASARFKSVASKIWRQIMEFLCATDGGILKFNLSAGGGRDYGALIALPHLLNFKKQLKIFIYNRRLK